MESEIECYCCQESSLIFDSVLKEMDKCVTELNVFRKMIEETEVLEVQSFGQKGVCRDMEGKIKPESLRHIAYGTFLQICSLYWKGSEICSPIMCRKENARTVPFTHRSLI